MVPHSNANGIGADTGTGKLPEHRESNLKPDEEADEDEDIDFNPFLKEMHSPEASSSLSSEIEALDVDFFESTEKVKAFTDRVKVCEHDGEESVMQTSFGPESEGKGPMELQRKEMVLSDQLKVDFSQEKDNGITGDSDVLNDCVAEEMGNTTSTRNPIAEFDDEDAICMRTRARYSLASITLDELETFLQETDNEDDLQNVDDEEEYRKFLAAVLQDGHGKDPINQDNGSVDDDEDDNDADFELEIEEALESDVDETVRGDGRNAENDEAVRRPETRQNRRQKASTRTRNKFSQKSMRPLRPLLPIFPNAPIASFPGHDGRNSMTETATLHVPCSAGNGYMNGFTPHQIGQLHCLIHEHLQLLLQIYSLCILDPSKQQIASQVQELLLEMLRECDQALAWRKFPHPDFCFRPPYIHSSVSSGPAVYCSTPCVVESTSVDKSDGSPAGMPTSGNISTSGGGKDTSQAIDGSSWAPFIRGPILSVLEVAPLNLVPKYMEDVKIAVQEYRRRQVQATCDTYLEKEPLFPLPNFLSTAEATTEVARGAVPMASNPVAASSPGQQLPKKTLAATLVENSRKQSVALVPKEIVKLAQRFSPLFNSALFPHKPPPAAVANRVLFTDSEDELLAMGLMEYNTDWKAIQQRFLPCKTKHQIFVRQKNRCSSKAQDNPIKAVRRMKTSPLTAGEQARIHEGLRLFKLDWMSVWKFIVPYRDPSLLPRQWRIALGTQKSYKTDDDKKEKRRLYEWRRRMSKARKLAIWQTASNKEDCQAGNAGDEINSGDDSIGTVDEAYVHEAFLADWRPGTSGIGSSGIFTNTGYTNSQSREQTTYDTDGAQMQSSSFQYYQHLQSSSHFSHTGKSPSNVIETNRTVTDFTLQSSGLQPYRVRRTNSTYLVKLAPDLPPVNLPPSVRILPRAVFDSYQSGPSKTGQAKSSPAKLDTMRSSVEESGVHMGKSTGKGEGKESILQMHPLLFQAPENGCFSYSSLKMDEGQPQVNLNLFHHPHPERPVSNFPFGGASTSSGIDFHPLLQRTDHVRSGSATVRSSSNLVGKASDLDLEIHLDSTSGRETNMKSRNLTQDNPISTLDLRAVTETRNGTGYWQQESELVPGVLPAGAVPGSDVDEQSLPEIVMEHEELSDSDEESEEPVEFECEEIDDSEGEEVLGCDQIDGTQNKEALRFASENALGNNQEPSASGGFPGAQPKQHIESVNGVVAAASGTTPCYPNRSCKKIPVSSRSNRSNKKATNSAEKVTFRRRLPH